MSFRPEEFIVASAACVTLKCEILKDRLASHDALVVAEKYAYPSWDYRHSEQSMVRANDWHECQ